MTRASNAYFIPPDLYDVMYSDIRLDIDFHIAEARSAGGPVLEPCCGNGRLMIPTLEAGVDCDGFDYDEPMLEDLRRKLAERGLEAGVFHADMRDFSLPRRYALVIIPFNSFLHNLSQEDQLATLRCCRAHLAPGGRLVVIAFHPSIKKLNDFNGTPLLIKEVPNLGGPGVVRMFDAITTDRIEQINTVKRRLEFMDPSGAVAAVHNSEFRLRYIFKPEMELLLRVAGFKRWDVRTAFERYNAPAGNDATAQPRASGSIQEGDILAWTAWRD